MADEKSSGWLVGSDKQDGMVHWESVLRTPKRSESSAERLFKTKMQTLLEDRKECLFRTNFGLKPVLNFADDAYEGSSLLGSSSAQQFSYRYSEGSKKNFAIEAISTTECDSFHIIFHFKEDSMQTSTNWVPYLSYAGPYKLDST